MGVVKPSADLAASNNLSRNNTWDMTLSYYRAKKVFHKCWAPKPRAGGDSFQGYEKRTRLSGKFVYQNLSRTRQYQLQQMEKDEFSLAPY